MIPNQWYAVLDSQEVKPAKPVGVTRFGEKMVFWRDAQGAVCCAIDRCPHRGAALSPGEVVGDHVRCAFHGFEFDGSGACVRVPANGQVAPVPKSLHIKTFAAREAHGFIWVWYGETRPDNDYPPIQFLDGIDDSFSHGKSAIHWHTHYSRAIENQLDVLHLPFIHRRTIGRSGKTLVNGPATFVQENVLRLWVDNTFDNGQAPRKPRDYTEIPDRPHQLQFIFPNVWENRISDDMRVVIAFAPIDDENTMMYLRFYQRFLSAPVLKQVVNWLGAKMNNYIANEDRSIVESQLPYRTALDIGEKLVPGDVSIIMYRRRREELIAAVEQNIPFDQIKIPEL